MKRLLLGLVLWVAACSPLVPATTPPQLFFTPGPALQFDGEQVVLGDFTLPIPAGWQLIKTSTAEEALRVVLASPDETLLITASLAPIRVLPTDEAGRALLFQETVAAPTTTLYLTGQAPPSAQTDLAPIWDNTMRSVMPASP